MGRTYPRVLSHWRWVADSWNNRRHLSLSLQTHTRRCSTNNTHPHASLRSTFTATTYDTRVPSMRKNSPSKRTLLPKLRQTTILTKRINPKASKTFWNQLFYFKKQRKKGRIRFSWFEQHFPALQRLEASCPSKTR